MDMKTQISREILRHHVSHDIFCRGCRQVMDVSRAVSLDISDRDGNLLRTYCHCVPCHENLLANGLMATAGSCGYTLDIADGRELFPGRKGRTKKV